MSITFGLTGGLASGKSAVARMLRDLGVKVIDADLLAREVVEKGTEGLSAVVAEFGADVLAPDGSLDRAKLGEIVFSDPEKRRALNRIVHPRIGMLTAERIAQFTEAGHPLICYEAALLVENGLVEAFRPLVVVALPEELQVKRAMVRDNVAEESVRARLAAQLPLSAKIAAADYVIDNSGDETSTRQQVADVVAAIQSKTTKK
ncbi:MAG: dephospho-CoA kinase [Polyangiaceae bacterium]|nr:dephospho-CoA kinase [Polyangiaceae bacterium]